MLLHRVIAMHDSDHVHALPCMHCIVWAQALLRCIACDSACLPLPIMMHACPLYACNPKVVCHPQEVPLRICFCKIVLSCRRICMLAAAVCKSCMKSPISLHALHAHQALYLKYNCRAPIIQHCLGQYGQFSTS